MERDLFDPGTARTFEVPVGTTGVTFVNIEHIDLSPRMQVEDMVGDPTVSVFIPEYFFPELEQNAQRCHVSGAFESRFCRPPTTGTTSRLWYAHALAKLLEGSKSEKSVAVVDIANTPQYLVAESVLHRAPSLAAVGSLATGLGAYGVVAGLITDLYWTYRRIAWSDYEAGLFDREAIPSYEKFIYDLADARRLFAAKGILKLASQYPDSRIVALYPEAHGIRIAHYLQNYSLTKELIYRPLVKSFALDTSVRQWKHTRGQWICFSQEAV